MTKPGWKAVLPLLVAVGALGFGLPALAASVGWPSNPFDPPPPDVTTVPSRDVGEDYKNNLAVPEVVVPVTDGSITDAERARIIDSIDPGDDPNIKVCVNDDGSGSVLFITPADPNAEVVPMPPGVTEESVPTINDKGRC